MNRPHSLQQAYVCYSVVDTITKAIVHKYHLLLFMPLKVVLKYHNELPYSRAAGYRGKARSLNPDAEHRGILSIKKSIRQKLR